MCTGSELWDTNQATQNPLFPWYRDPRYGLRAHRMRGGSPVDENRAFELSLSFGWVFWLGRSDRGGWKSRQFPSSAGSKMGLNVGKSYRILCDLHGYLLPILC